ncbi:hypothetical protein BDV12DRAFT_200542 [Aspergillus spectabilis]
MRFSLFLLSLSIINHNGVLAEPPKDPHEILGNAEALAGLKDFVSIANTLSSLVDDKQKDKSSPFEREQDVNPADSGKDNGPIDLLNGIEALAQIKSVADIASTLFSALGDKGISSPNQQAREHAVGDSEPSREAIDYMKGIGALQQFASLASGFDSLGEERDIPRPSPGKQVRDDTGIKSGPREPLDVFNGLKALQQVASLASGLGSLVEDKGNVPTSSRGNQMRATAWTPPTSGESLDFVKGLKALQQFASLAANLGPLIENTAKEVPMSPPDIPMRPKVINTPTPPHPSSKSEGPPSKPPSSPPTEPLDFVSRLEALKTLTTLASKLSSLTNTTSTTPLPTRLQILFSDPEISSSLHYILSNAHKILTPEILHSLKSFARTTPLLPAEYLDITIIILDSMGAIFSPEFVTHYQAAKKTLDDVGIDFLPVMGYTWRGVQWVMGTFDPGYIQFLNKQIALWRKAIASDQMTEFLAWITDPETIRGVTSRIEMIKRKLTADRIHALNLLFEETGLFTLSDEQYQSFGAELGTKFRIQFATPHGITQVRGVLQMLRAVREGPVGVAENIKMRARVLTPDISDDIALLLEEVAAVGDVIPHLVDALDDAVGLIYPLLDFGARADRVLSWAFWGDLKGVTENIFSVPGESLVGVQRALQVLERMLEPKKAQQLRVLIADVTGGVSAPRVFGFMPVSGNGNLSYMVMGSDDGVLRMGMSPVLAPDGLDGLFALLRRVDWFLEPGEVEKTRETVRVLNQAGLFILRVIEVFEGKELTAGGFEGHDEL